MTLRRRLLLLLLAAAPLLWLLTLALTVLIGRREVNELFDTQQVRLAQQVLVMLPNDPAQLAGSSPRLPLLAGSHGEAELKEMAIAVSSQDGRLLMTDREGVQLPRQTAPGFADITIDGEAWRVYTLASADGQWRVAVGQMIEERDEVMWDLLATQTLPGLLALPALLAAIAWAVKRALRPLEDLRDDIQGRSASALQPIDVGSAPGELQPLLASMNALLERVESALEHERRLTADAAHELRTPLAALRAQWEAAQLATDPALHSQAQQQIGAGIERLTHLVDQLLQLARAEGTDAVQVAAMSPINWTNVVQSALSDCLPLLDATGSDVEVEWPAHGISPLPLNGSEPLMTTLLRNLLDNALRYGPRRSTVRLRFGADSLSIEDQGPGLSEAALRRLGDRFYRPPGQDSPGSGLGVSIVQRIADLHHLSIQVANRPASEGGGLRVELRRA